MKRNALFLVLLCVGFAAAVSGDQYFGGDAVFLGKLEIASTGSLKVPAGIITTTMLANSGVTAATYGAASSIAQLAVDATGRITSAVNVAISGLDTSVISAGTFAAARIPSIDTSKLATDAVDSTKIKTGAVTATKLGASFVDSGTVMVCAGVLVLRSTGICP